MLIVSQDKTGITNFDNVNTLRATKTGEVISFDNSYKSEYNCSDILGQYKTEERAKEVLEELFCYKAIFEYYKYSPRAVQKNIEEDFIKDDVMFDTFEMPEN